MTTILKEYISVPVSGHDHYTIETKENQIKVKNFFSNVKIMPRYSHQISFTKQIIR